MSTSIDLGSEGDPVVRDAPDTTENAAGAA